VKEKGEDAFVAGETLPEEREHNWLKKNVKKIQPVIPATSPVLSFSKSKRVRPRRVCIADSLRSNIDLEIARFLNGCNVGLLESDAHGFKCRRCSGMSLNMQEATAGLLV
jgi:hypothetical protein